MGSTVHHGQLVEIAVRKKGISITELALMLNIHRRTLYKWFESEILKPQIIYRIGMKIHYDFYVDFPQFFKSDSFSCENVRKANATKNDIEAIAWKDRYIDLLEKYTEMLALERTPEKVA